MHAIIDVSSNVGPYAKQLADAGVRTVIRYYNHQNSSSLPSKCLTASELSELHGAGLTVAVVFQQRGGKDGSIEDLSEASGNRDAKRALDLADKLKQPSGSAIYFAVDWDYYRDGDLDQIASYFTAVKSQINSAYNIGVYGSGTVAQHLKKRGLVDHIWLAGAKGWSGTREALRQGAWTIFQKNIELKSEIGGFIYDGNVLNPAWTSFGQFSADKPEEMPRGVGVSALYAVKARDGLNLRSGPDVSFRKIQNLPFDTIVTGVEREGGWLKVDLEGDGRVDGYVAEAYVVPVSGGLPLKLAPDVRPIDVARAEMSLGVREAPGDQNNPRIVMYHATTTGGASPDQIAWCSSFVNYCVEQAGLKGTDSKWAKSWHDKKWGVDVTSNPAEGDIVVFGRTKVGTEEERGHVGFYLGREGDSIRVLGGNQGQRVCIDLYPANGIKGNFHFKLLSIRRG
ncbi:MAG TPA: TIGR02594 family protein [Alphaproteobacteria bacterium]|nr:TIGR02594 family protein [Alphaproteobacteria bacterium]